MGAIDTEAKAYLSSPDKVADAFNYWVYGGRDVIKPEGLTPLDTTAIALPPTATMPRSQSRRYGMY